MGLFGGSSKVSTNTTNHYTTETTNVALDDIEGTAITNSGDNVSMTVTDFGAVSEALEFAGGAFDEANTLAFEAIEAAERNSVMNTGTVERVALATANNGQTVVADSIVSIFKPFALALLGSVVLIAVVMVWKGGKRV